MQCQTTTAEAPHTAVEVRVRTVVEAVAWVATKPEESSARQNGATGHVWVKLIVPVEATPPVPILIDPAVSEALVLITGDVPNPDATEGLVAEVPICKYRLALAPLFCICHCPLAGENIAVLLAHLMLVVEPLIKLPTVVAPDLTMLNLEAPPTWRSISKELALDGPESVIFEKKLVYVAVVDQVAV